MKDTRYKLPASRRTIGGKVYQYLAVGNKMESDRDADWLRGKGYNVRVVPYRGKVATYFRRP